MNILWQAEDSPREKKVKSDLKGLLKMMVALRTRPHRDA